MATRAGLYSRGAHAVRRVPFQPVEIFLWTRSAIWLGAIFVVTLFDVVSGAFRVPLDPRWDIDIGWGIGLWSRWDSGWLLRIVEQGYVEPERSTAFFPLYPLLVKGSGHSPLGSLHLRRDRCVAGGVRRGLRRAVPAR